MPWPDSASVKSSTTPSETHHSSGDRLRPAGVGHDVLARVAVGAHVVVLDHEAVRRERGHPRARRHLSARRTARGSPVRPEPAEARGGRSACRRAPASTGRRSASSHPLRLRRRTQELGGAHEVVVHRLGGRIGVTAAQGLHDGHVTLESATRSVPGCDTVRYVRENGSSRRHWRSSVALRAARTIVAWNDALACDCSCASSLRAAARMRSSSASSSASSAELIRSAARRAARASARPAPERRRAGRERRRPARNSPGRARAPRSPAAPGPAGPRGPAPGSRPAPARYASRSACCLGDSSPPRSAAGSRPGSARAGCCEETARVRWSLTAAAALARTAAPAPQPGRRPRGRPAWPAHRGPAHPGRAPRASAAPRPGSQAPASRPSWAAPARRRAAVRRWASRPRMRRPSPSAADRAPSSPDSA